MAYGNQNRATYGQPATNSTAARPVAAAGGGKKPLFRTGLFAPNKEGVKSKGNVQIKEDVLIKAGSYINLYVNDDRKTEASPVFTITITEGKLKPAVK